jgi:hypothetical protein
VKILTADKSAVFLVTSGVLKSASWGSSYTGRNIAWALGFDDETSAFWTANSASDTSDGDVDFVTFA